MLDSSGSDLAYVATSEEEDEDELRPLPVSEEDDYDVYDAKSPIRSNRDAWWGVAGMLALTVLIAWLFYTFLEAPAADNAAQLPTATMGDLTAAPRSTPLYVNSVPPTPKALTVRVVEPQTVGTRARSSEDEPPLHDHLASYTDGTSISEAYGEFETRNFLLIGAVSSSRLAYPDQELTILLDHLVADDPALGEFQVIYAGPLGGVARCSASTFSDLSKVVCAWADEQSMGVVTWIDQPWEAAKAEFISVRALIEQPV